MRQALRFHATQPAIPSKSLQPHAVVSNLKIQPKSFKAPSTLLLEAASGVISSGHERPTAAKLPPQSILVCHHNQSGISHK